MNLYNVLLEPVLSEKSTAQREKNRKITFKVNKDATKLDVLKAIRTLYDAKVTSVRTLIVRGKMKRRGRFVSRTPHNFKKAIITLAEGSKIPLFDE